MAINEVFLNHKGGRYVYKTHQEKISQLCQNGFTSLKSYLEFVQKNCPNHYFNKGPRSSCLKFNLVDSVEEIKHEVSFFAKHGLEINKERFYDAHSRVQNFLLEHDKNTIAMEIPIWLMPDELSGYRTVFNSDEVLNGHIDLLRLEKNKVWIWDFKPQANKEKYASTQIFFYAYMLAKRTGIPLQDIHCGYFDQYFAFSFQPETSFLHKLNKQRTLS